MPHLYWIVGSSCSIIIKSGRLTHNIILLINYMLVLHCNAIKYPSVLKPIFLELYWFLTNKMSVECHICIIYILVLRVISLYR